MIKDVCLFHAGSKMRLFLVSQINLRAVEFTVRIVFIYDVTGRVMTSAGFRSFIILTKDFASLFLRLSREIKMLHFFAPLRVCCFLLVYWSYYGTPHNRRPEKVTQKTNQRKNTSS